MNEAHARRLLDAVFEDGKMRNPLKGLFPKDMPVPSMATALHDIGQTFPNLHPTNGLMVKMARKHLKKVDLSKYPGLTEDEGVAIILYTMVRALFAALRPLSPSALTPLTPLTPLALLAGR